MNRTRFLACLFASLFVSLSTPVSLYADLPPSDENEPGYDPPVWWFIPEADWIAWMLNHPWRFYPTDSIFYQLWVTQWNAGYWADQWWFMDGLFEIPGGDGDVPNEPVDPDQEPCTDC